MTFYFWVPAGMTITPLINASRHGRLDAVKTLLSLGADPDFENEDDVTALTISAQHGFCEIVEVLAKCSSRINITKALMFAIARSEPDVFDILLDHEPDLYFNYHGFTAPVLAKTLQRRNMMIKLMVEEEVQKAQRNGKLHN